MNDDRMTELLHAAADLRPSTELERRVRTAVPRGPRWSLGVGFGVALSGMAGVAAVIAFGLMPRESSAEEILLRAAENQNRVSGRVRTESFRNGVWRVSASVLFAPGWQRVDYAQGRLELQTPEGRFERVRIGDPVLRVPPRKKHGDEGFRLADHLRFLRRLGKQPVMTKDEPRMENGRRVQRVTILVRPNFDRELFTMDVDADLPITIVQEYRRHGRWTPSVRVTFDYTAPEARESDFWAGIDRARIIDTASLARKWEQRLSPVRARLALSGGQSLSLRDVRALPAGDVLLLYTGPAELKARLVGSDGTSYVRVPFSLNDAHANPPRPPIAPGGEPLRGLWFAPEIEGAPGLGRSVRVRLEILEEGESGKRVFPLHPVRERAELPEWAEAIDNQWLAENPDYCREDARLMAAYDGWIDGKGRKVSGTYQLAPKFGDFAEYDPPRRGLRRDPDAARAAAVIFRRMMARAKAKGWPMESWLVESRLGRFEREAGQSPKP